MQVVRFLLSLPALLIDGFMNGFFQTFPFSRVTLRSSRPVKGFLLKAEDALAAKDKGTVAPDLSFKKN
jgi:hypothetical protein